MTHKIVYVTGAPAVGKTTAVRAVALGTGAQVFSYGAVLTERLNERVRSQADLRTLSSRVISSEDVVATDVLLAEVAATNRSAGGILLVDSHAVTKERYGFRCIPYSMKSLAAVGYTHLLCLFAEVEEVARRIAADPDGRPLPSLRDLEVHNAMQRSLTLSYAHSLGCPAYFVRSDDSAEHVAEAIREALDI